MNSNYTTTVLVYVAIVAAFYFIWYRPLQRQRKATIEMLAALMPGDRIVTAGGIYGTVRVVDGDSIDVEIAPQVVVRVAKSAVVSRVEAESGPLDE